MAGIRAIWACCRQGQAGSVAVEFAVVVPVLLTIYLGGVDATEALTTYRKLGETTVELANVAAQYNSMSASDVSTVMNASAQIMEPYASASLQITLSEISTDANNNPSVVWSQAFHGGAALQAGANVSLPAGLATANTYYILVQTTYPFQPITGFTFTKPITMSNRVVMLPRQSPSIPYTG